MMVEKSWTELQALAVRAATGAGVPPSQALGFGAMVPRHLADDGSEDPLSDALDTPGAIVSLAQQIETIVEQASLSPRIVAVQNPNASHCALLVSWLASLPCKADVVTTAEGIQACLSLKATNVRVRPERVAVSRDLFAQMEALAKRTYVPDSAESRESGAGADAMVLD